MLSRNYIGKTQPWNTSSTALGARLNRIAQERA